MSKLCRQLRHEVTKKAIKAPQHCLPHLTHPIQLVRSLVETLRPEVSQKR